MADLVCALEVCLPDAAARASRAYARVKAQAEVRLTLEGGGERALYIPPRVARLVDVDDLALPISVSDLTHAIDELGARTCYTVLVEMLSRRDHSREEARQKLRSSGYTERQVEAALDRAASYRYLDDDRFARQFIEQRVSRGWGRVKIECELRRRGVDPHGLEGYPEAYFDFDRDLERAVHLLARKSVPSTRPVERLARHLMNKGFSSHVAFEAARRRVDGASEDTPSSW